MIIQSPQNPKIQRVKGLLGRHKDRLEQNSFVLEGVRLIEEAMLTGALPDLLLYSNEGGRALKLIQQARSAGVETEQVQENILASVGDTHTTQGLLGVFSIPNLPIPDKLDFILILDGVSDPGNMGTLLRTASAAAVQLVILAPTTTDAFAPKVVRSAMGAHFHLPIRYLDWEEIGSLKQHAEPKISFLSSDMNGGKSCWESDLVRPVAVIIGSEAAGVSSQALQLADDRIHIPMPGKIESLNASIAASILIFEVIRQRTK